MQTPHFNHLQLHLPHAVLAPGAPAGKLLEAGARDEQVYTESMSADLHQGEDRPATSFKHPLFDDPCSLNPHSPIKSIII